MHNNSLRGSKRANSPLAMTALAALAWLVLLSPPARAEPTQRIKVIVPLPPGGAGDIVARALAAQITETQKAEIVIENRPGAGSIIGTELVAQAAPNGATLLINAPYLLIGPQVRKLNYDPLTSFEAVCYLVSSPGIIVVNAASPYHTLGEFLAAARAKPGELTLASVGPLTAQHIGAVQLRQAASANFTYVPFPGGAPAINALLGNHVTAVLAEYAPLAAHIKAGALRALATTSAKRIDALPNLPTVAEQGIPNYEVDLWWSLFAPAKTSKDTVAKIAALFTSAMQAPAVKAKLAALGFVSVANCGPEFSALLRKQYNDYGRIIREANMKVE